MAGEAVLPEAAWQQVKLEIQTAHAAAIAEVEAQRTARRTRLLPLVERLNLPCHIENGRTCQSLVVIDPRARVELSLRAGLGTPQAPCDLVDTINLLAPRPVTMTVALATATATVRKPIPAAAPADAAPIVNASARFRASKAARALERVDGLVCEVQVRQRWWRLLNHEERLHARLAAGQTLGVGTTVELPPARKFVIGSSVIVNAGDHVKLVLAVGDGYLGGALTRFDGKLPFVLQSDSFKATCR